MTAQWKSATSELTSGGFIKYAKTINVKPQPRVDNSLAELEEFLSELTGDGQWS